jgi:hypothetical protein
MMKSMKVTCEPQCVEREVPHGVGRHRRGDRYEQPAGVRIVRLRPSAQPPEHSPEQQDPGEESKDADINERAQPLVVEDASVRIGAGGYPGAEPIAEEGFLGDLVERWPDVGDAP